MRRISPKRSALLREVQPWRYEFRARIGRCEYCLRDAAPEWLTLHEIARGCHRQKCLTAPFGLLCVHWVVAIGHELSPCHANVQRESLARQLARLYLVRSSDFDLAKFHALTGRKFPDQADVDAEMSNILGERR